MGILKYFGERGGDGSEHGGQLHWPGTPAGFPFRGRQVPTLTAEETEDIPTAFDFHCRVFELWTADELKEYQQIRDRAANGWYQITHIERLFDEDKKNWRVYMEWNQIYGELPKGKSPNYSGATNNAETSTQTIKLDR
jgi:hypothetical protein|tara:strand:- start:597 stop:1010 length:414 start_codon:yes stop_codon:yes gene_type:complete